MKFGNVNPEFFTSSIYGIDSNVDAVILFDKGVVHIDQLTSLNNGFNIVFDRHTCIRILNKNAFSLSTVVLGRSKKAMGGLKIENMKGITSNMEDGKLVQTQLSKNDILTEENGNYELKKIVLPAVHEGSIIEYTYRVIYPGFEYIPSWDFQGEYPILWSEFDITIPSVLDYLIKKQGYLKFAEDTSIMTNQRVQLNIPSGSPRGPVHDEWQFNAIERIWAVHNAPPIEKAENYITSLKNYNCRIEFQLSAFHLLGVDRTFTTTWPQLVGELMKNEKFGIPLNDRNHWMKNELKEILGAENNPVRSAQKIYSFLRDHFDCNQMEAIYLSQPFRKTWEDKKGNVADINLLLTALLRQQGLDASPVLLSTRAFGRAYEPIPLIKDYNYVITRLIAGEQIFLLDASRNTIGFGQLPEFCYNGYGRTIDSSCLRIPLSPDSVNEQRTTLVILGNDSLGYSGNFNHKAGVFESMEIRRLLKKTKTEDFFEAVRKTFPPYKTMESNGIDSIDNPEELLTWHYDMLYDFSSPIIYFNPIMHERIGTNPFNAPERHYPVEMPFCEDYSYAINMEIPKGYVIAELPKSERVELGGAQNVMFEYIIQKNDDGIQLQCRLRIRKTYFRLDEYKALRDFFAFIIRKEKEQIVFKKK